MSESVYISRNGEQDGPYNAEQIQQMLAEGSIAQYTLAWKVGMEEWAPLMQILDSFAPQPSSARTPIPIPPAVPIQQTIPMRHAGIGRFACFSLCAGSMILGHLLKGALPSESSTTSLITLILAILWIIPITLRLQNIGRSGWWFLLLFIPFVNIYVAALCLFAPAGYAQSKKLDTSARVILLLIIGVIILMAIQMCVAAS